MGTTSFVVEGNRVYAELGFVRPDGTVHRALAFVDLGSQMVELDPALYRELQVGTGKPVTIRVGEMPVTVAADAVTNSGEPPRSVGQRLKVEAVLPAGVMQRYQVTIDYGRHTLTLAERGMRRPPGVPVPFRINAKTGLIAVQVGIDGQSYAMTVDNGSAYTWFRQSTAKGWLRAHPTWEHGVGAVGPSNMRMADDGAEAAGILLRLPAITVGAVTLHDVGALAIASTTDVGKTDLFDWYSAKNAVPVIGWIGGNLLKGSRLTIDYHTHTLYWLQQRPLDPHDLDQVGLTLERLRDDYVVAAVATQRGAPTVAGVRPGDALLRIDALDAHGASAGSIYAALHGRPGAIRVLTLRRGMTQFQVRARVTRF
jgi:hypothetical protein